VVTETEFEMAIILMFTGVIFYSRILTELLDIIVSQIMVQEEIQNKIQNLKEVILAVDVPVSIAKEIERRIYEYFDELDEEQIELKFKNVNKRDVEQLLYEASRHQLSEFNILKIGDRSRMIEFHDKMKEIKFRKGDLIFRKGDAADNFFIIKSGSVEYRSEFKSTGYSWPFYRIEEGYFGEYELIQDSKRQFDCHASSKTIVYAINKDAFYDIFLNKDKQEYTNWKENSQKRVIDIIQAKLQVFNLIWRNLRPIDKFKQIIRSKEFKKLVVRMREGRDIFLETDINDDVWDLPNEHPKPSKIKVIPSKIPLSSVSQKNPAKVDGAQQLQNIMKKAKRKYKRKMQE